VQDAKREWASAGREWQEDSQLAMPADKPHYCSMQSHDSIQGDGKERNGAQAFCELADEKASHGVASESPRDSNSRVCAKEILPNRISPNQHASPDEACRERTCLPGCSKTQNKAVIELHTGEKLATPRSRSITFDQTNTIAESNEDKEKMQDAGDTGESVDKSQNFGKNAARRSCFSIPMFTPQLPWKGRKFLEAECMSWLRIRSRKSKCDSKPISPESSQISANASQPTERDEERQHMIASLFFDFVRMKGGSVCLGDVEEFYGSAPRDARACVYRAGTKWLFRIRFCAYLAESGETHETHIFAWVLTCSFAYGFGTFNVLRAHGLYATWKLPRS
jgi:hypothetical protein